MESMSDVTHVAVGNQLIAVTTLLKRKDVLSMVGLCYTTVYNLEKAGKFPSRRHLSPGRVAWLRSEVEDWIRALPAV
jgi:prophage regulatory protein